MRCHSRRHSNTFMVLAALWLFLATPLCAQDQSVAIGAMGGQLDMTTPAASVQINAYNPLRPAG